LRRVSSLTMGRGCRGLVLVTIAVSFPAAEIVYLVHYPLGR